MPLDNWSWYAYYVCRLRCLYPLVFSGDCWPHPLKKEYERVNALSPQQAMTEYRAKKNRPESVPVVNSSAVENIIKSMDNRGAWIEEISIPDYEDVVNNPRRTLRGINTSTYIRNMRTMINYLKAHLIWTINILILNPKMIINTAITYYISI